MPIPWPNSESHSLGLTYHISLRTGLIVFLIHWTLLQISVPKILCSSASSLTKSKIINHSLLPTGFNLGIQGPPGSPPIILFSFTSNNSQISILPLCSLLLECVLHPPRSGLRFSRTHCPRSLSSQLCLVKSHPAFKASPDHTSSMKPSLTSWAHSSSWPPSEFL